MTNVPSGASDLLAFIRKAETGEAGEDAYRTIIGHKQGELEKPITAMTVDELIAAQKSWPRRWRRLNSSAAGAYQIIRKTLEGLKRSLKLTGREKFTAEFQDRLGYELMRQRGYEKAVRGEMPADEFALALAKEWASMPVLKDMTVDTNTGTDGLGRRKTRRLERGQSYYDGDGVNSAQVSASAFWDVVSKAVGAGRHAPRPKPSPLPATAPEAPTAQQVIDIQERLRSLGYHEVGAVDGIVGPATENAILIFRKDHGLPLSTRIDATLRDALLKASPRQVADSRANAEPKDVREQAPEAKASWWSGLLALIGAGFSGFIGFIGWIVGNIGEARNLLKPVTDLLGAVPWWAWPVLIAVGLLVIWGKSRQAEHGVVAAYRDGVRR